MKLVELVPQQLIVKAFAERNGLTFGFSFLGDPYLKWASRRDQVDSRVREPPDSLYV